MVEQLQKSVEVIPPVIVALDTESIESARRIVDDLERFSRDEVAFIVRQGMLDSRLLHDLIDGGWFVIGGTRFADAPSKVALDISLALRERDEDGNARALPHALTFEPFKTTDVRDIAIARDMVRSMQAVSVRRHNWPAHAENEVTVSLIGTAQPEEFHRSDGQQIGMQAAKDAANALKVGVHAFEVVFNGLSSFFEERANIAEAMWENNEVKDNLLNGRDMIVLASKLSLSDGTIQAAASTAYGLGVRAVILGDSVITNSNRVDLLQDVLDRRTT